MRAYPVVWSHCAVSYCEMSVQWPIVDISIKIIEI